MTPGFEFALPLPKTPTSGGRPVDLEGSGSAGLAWDGDHRVSSTVPLKARTWLFLFQRGSSSPCRAQKAQKGTPRQVFESIKANWTNAMMR